MPPETIRVFCNNQKTKSAFSRPDSKFSIDGFIYADKIDTDLIFDIKN